MQPVTAIVETPKGSTCKFDYDKKLKAFKLNKALPAGMAFPLILVLYQVQGGDGDPLDIIIISEIKTFTGCILDCKIIGGLTAEQREKNNEVVRNDRFLGVPTASFLFADTTSIKDLPKDFIQQLENFFINYNKAEGKKFKVIKELGATAAYHLIKK